MKRRNLTMRSSALRRTIVWAIVLGALAAFTPAGHATESEVVTLPGTGDSTDVLRALAQSYSAQYPDRRVSIPNSISTDGGIRVVGKGEFPIGRVARLPNAEEVARYGEFSYIEFARVPVTFVVTPDTGVQNLSQQQICDVFSGRITNWKDVGGNDLPIQVQSRPDGSNLQIIRKTLACWANLEVTPKAQYRYRNTDLIEAMKTVPGAIGFMPLSEATLNGYRTLALDGISVTMPHYPLGIGLGFVHKGALSNSVRAFLDYLYTEPARNIMRTTGHVPVAR
jgi:phosphate transport system substrate-binding protein